jgi:hypothetical protein
MTLVSNTFYVAGGTLPHDSQCYVCRDADRTLLTALERGEFCHVLTSRQMGKSSLMVRTATALRTKVYASRSRAILTQQLFGAMVRRTAALPVGTG